MTKRESQKKIRDLGSEAQRTKEARLETERAPIAAEKEAPDAELRRARPDISKLEARARELEEELAESSRRTMSDLQTEKRASDRKLTKLSGQLRTLGSAGRSSWTGRVFGIVRSGGLTPALRKDF